MKEPRFLSVAEVERLHEMALERFGGSLGLRNRNGFESAVMHPQNVYFYGDGDIYEIAAAYCFHLAEAQAFLDGNKWAANGVTVQFSIDAISRRSNTTSRTRQASPTTMTSSDGLRV